MLIIVSLATLGAILVYESFWFLLTIIFKRHDIADIAWGLGFVVAFAVSYLLGAEGTNRQLLVGVLVILWGVRLFLHIGTRYFHKKEDTRYTAFKAKWKNFVALRAFVFVFMLQGALLWIIALQLIYLNVNDVGNSLGWLDGLGLTVWFIGFIFESFADLQLRLFVSKPGNKGKIMDKGLWKYSRHPNYFGEVLQWWGIFVIILNVAGGFLMFISPLTITVLLLFISGIPMLESAYKDNKDYQYYKKRTSIFIPWFSKK